MKLEHSTQAASPVTKGAPLKLDSVALFAGQREIIIMHQGEAYRLRITRQEKMILTK